MGRVPALLSELILGTGRAAAPSSAPFVCARPQAGRKYFETDSLFVFGLPFSKYLVPLWPFVPHFLPKF